MLLVTHLPSRSATGIVMAGGARELRLSNEFENGIFGREEYNRPALDNRGD